MSKPSNWYNMSWEEQRAWQRAESEREDLEYRARQAQEEAEQVRRDAQREARRAQAQFSAMAEEVNMELEDAIQQQEVLKLRVTELEDLARRARIALTFYRQYMWKELQTSYPSGYEVEKDIEAAVPDAEYLGVDNAKIHLSIDVFGMMEPTTEESRVEDPDPREYTPPIGEDEGGDETIVDDGE